MSNTQNINWLISNHNFFNNQNYALWSIVQLPFNFDLATEISFNHWIKLYDFTKRKYTDFSQIIPVILPLMVMSVCLLIFYKIMTPHIDYISWKKEYINTKIYKPVILHTPLGSSHQITSKKWLYLYYNIWENWKTTYESWFPPLNIWEITILICSTAFFTLMFWVFISRNLMTRNSSASFQINLSQNFQLSESYLFYYKEKKYVSLPKTH